MFFSLWYHYWPIWKLVRYGMLKRQCPILSILLAMHSQLQFPKTHNGQINVKMIWDVKYPALLVCYANFFFKYNRKRQRPIHGQKHISKKHATNPLLNVYMFFLVWCGMLNIQFQIFSIFIIGGFQCDTEFWTSSIRYSQYSSTLGTSLRWLSTTVDTRSTNRLSTTGVKT